MAAKVLETVETIPQVQVPMIYPLIGQAMSKIRAIGKDSTATNMSGKQMYKFRGIDDVYNALNPVMAELGLFIIPEVIEHNREERKSTSGATLLYSIIKVRFTMFAPDGSCVSGTVIGEGMDSGDKATNKAMSIAMKYFCFQTFMIPTEEMKDPDCEMKDPDAEVHEVLPKQTSVQNGNSVKRDAPAVVTTASKIPAPVSQSTTQQVPENPVFKYLNNAQAYMATKLGIADKKEMKIWFAQARKGLIAGKVVPDIPPTDLTMEQAKQLVEAIYLNCMGDAK